MDIARGATLPPVQVAPTVGAPPDALGPTELPARKVVTAVSAELPTSPPETSTARSGLDGTTERRVVIDPDTRQLVNETIDSATHEIVGQLPDRAMLGLRAYLDGLARQQDEAASSRNAVRHILPALIA